MSRRSKSDGFRLLTSNICLGIFPLSDFPPENDLIVSLRRFVLDNSFKAPKINFVVSSDPHGFVILQNTMGSLGDELNMLNQHCKTYIARYTINNISSIKRLSLDSNNIPYDNQNGSLIVFVGSNYDTKIEDVVVIDLKTSENCSSIYKYFLDTVKYSKQISSRLSPENMCKNISYSVLLEVYEEDNNGSYYLCNRTKDYFKVRRTINKKVRILVFNCSKSSNLPRFKDCENFEINFPNVDSFVPLSNILLEIGKDDGCSFRLTGDWNPLDKTFDKLFAGNANDIFNGQVRIVMTSPDLQEKFTLLASITVCIFDKNDRFWPSDKSPFHSIISVALKGVESTESLKYTVVTVNNLSSTDMDDLKNYTNQHICHLFSGGSETSSIGQLLPVAVNDDDAVFSGTEFGIGEIPSTAVCNNWEAIFKKWVDMGHIPMELYAIVREAGIPNYFRCSCWKMICKVEVMDEELTAKYYELLEKNSDYEKVITPDVRRTFPLHPFFSDQQGKGQQSLFNICKAYSLYDEEVGYCQGMSFIVAVVLLQMDEITAFCMFVKLMYAYQLRELYKASFEALQEQMYIIRRHLAHSNPGIEKHFNKIGVDSHMYLPQWILTCFTAKFPLSLANIVLDNLLLDGMMVITKFSLGIIQLSSETLKSMTFDEIMRYFRVSLPRLYYSKVNVINLLKITKSITLSNSLLEAYKVDFMAYKMKNFDMNDIEAIKCENRVLFDRLMRMESETDLIAQELISTQFTFQNRIAEDECKIFALTKNLQESDDKTVVLEQKLKNKTEEGVVLLDTLQDKLCNHMDELSRKDEIISQYKNICKTLEDSSNKLQLEHESMVRSLQDGSSLCTDCVAKLNERMEHGTYVYQPMDTGLTNAEAELVNTKVALADAEVKIGQLLKQVRDLENKLNSSWIQKFTSNMRN